MIPFVENLNFEEILPFDPSARSDEVVVQIVEKPVEVERVKIVKEPAPEPIVKTVFIPAAPPPAPTIAPEEMNKILLAIGKMAETRPNVEVSVAPTPVSVTPQAVQVTPQITVNESPTPRRWKVTVTERDSSPEKRIKELTIEAVD